MKFHRLDSSNIHSVAYSSKQKALIVKFSSGSIYTYRDVPMWQYMRMKRAESHGSYFSRHIKGNYETKYIDYPSATTSDKELVALLLESIRLQGRKKELHESS